MTSRIYDFLPLASFNEAIEIWLNGSRTRKLLTRSDYDTIKAILKNLEQETPKTESISYRYWVKKNFTIQKIGVNDIVMKIGSRRSKKNNDNDNTKPLLVKEELYDAFCEAHLQNDHGGLNQTWNNVKKKWGGIKQDLIELLVRRCLTCSSRNNVRNAKVVGKPIIAKSFMSRLQVTFILYLILNKYLSIHYIKRMKIIG